ncbi:hypothetical protein OK074_0134 [Actinobacteria bacterium OK074]|nr:hypothetical protein OK074_0134 [Actinobacteria bacterium OK074]
MDEKGNEFTALVRRLKEADADLVAYHLADGTAQQNSREAVVDGTATGAVATTGTGTIAVPDEEPVAVEGRRTGAVRGAREAGAARGDGTRSTRPAYGVGTRPRPIPGPGPGPGPEVTGEVRIRGAYLVRQLTALAAAIGAVAVVAAPPPWSVLLGVVVVAVAFLGSPAVRLLAARHRGHGEGRDAGLDLLAGGAAAAIVTVVATLAADRRS